MLDMIFLWFWLDLKSNKPFWVQFKIFLRIDPARCEFLLTRASWRIWRAFHWTLLFVQITAMWPTTTITQYMIIWVQFWSFLPSKALQWNILSQFFLADWEEVRDGKTHVWRWALFFQYLTVPTWKEELRTLKCVFNCVRKIFKTTAVKFCAEV